MADDEQDEMQTTPEGDEREALDLPGEGGNTIPVPKREDVLGDLAKVAKPAKPRQRPSDGRAGGSE